jgi:TolB protein
MVYVYDILAGATIQLTENSQGVSGTPAWSPDGRKIAFIYRGNADHTIAIVDSGKEMQQPRVLWEGHGLSRSPSWAPNEKILVYANPQGVNDIYMLDPNGKEAPAKPFEGKLNFHPKDVSWSADGAGIVFIKPN